MPHTPLTEHLIEDGLRRPVSFDPLFDAAHAIEAARRALQAAGSFAPGPQRDTRLGDAVGHLDTARHYVWVERVHSERPA